MNILNVYCFINSMLLFKKLHIIIELLLVKLRRSFNGLNTKERKNFNYEPFTAMG